MTSQPSPAIVCPDLAQLQGDWTIIEGRRPGELIISGRTFTFRFLDGTFYKGTFDLLPEGPPQAMLMHIEEGPPRHKGKSAWCLYELEVGLLRWCPTEPGSNERLTAFPDLDDSRYLHIVLRRDEIDLD
jgi:hypothetical protein